MEALTDNMLTSQKQKTKKSQQCVYYQNTCSIGTISKAEEITGIFFYTSVSSIYSLDSLLLHMLMDLCSEIIILTNFGQQLIWPNMYQMGIRRN